MGSYFREFKKVNKMSSLTLIFIIMKMSGNTRCVKVRLEGLRGSGSLNPPPGFRKDGRWTIVRRIRIVENLVFTAYRLYT